MHKHLSSLNKASEEQELAEAKFLNFIQCSRRVLVVNITENEYAAKREIMVPTNGNLKEKPRKITEY
jgi:hypothetical protein